jgi:hypothetical protein
MKLIDNFKIKNLFLFIFFVIIFTPKIDIIDITGYWQGIRLEDLCLLGYTLYIITFWDRKIINNNLLNKFLPLISYFVLVFFGSFISNLSGIEINYFSLVRVLEYFVLIILVCNLKMSYQTVLIYLKFYILMNIIVVILQEYQLFGSFTSIGYLEPGHPLNTRKMGLTGGSWELGIIASLCYFIIISIEKPKLPLIFIYLIITIYLNLIAESRINFIAFCVANLFFLKSYIKNYEYFYTIIIIILITLISVVSSKYLNFQLLDNPFDRLISTDYLQSMEILKKFFLVFELPQLGDLDVTVWSLWYRLSLWEKLIVPYIDNFFTIIFGHGTYAVYYESAILRVVLTTGLIGTIYTIFMIRKLELYIVCFFLIAGLTLDVFNSFKIFGFTVLYYRLLYEKNSYRRN